MRIIRNIFPFHFSLSSRVLGPTGGREPGEAVDRERDA